MAVNNNNKRLSSTIGNQLYMVESKDNSVTSMSLTFYSDSACTTALNTITFNGNIGASSQVVNKTLFEAAMKAMGVGDYPYSGK